MRKLTAEVKILIFKTYISKVVHLTLVKEVPSSKNPPLDKTHK